MTGISEAAYFAFLVMLSRNCEVSLVARANDIGGVGGAAGADAARWTVPRAKSTWKIWSMNILTDRMQAGVEVYLVGDEQKPQQ